MSKRSRLEVAVAVGVTVRDGIRYSFNLKLLASNSNDLITVVLVYHYRTDRRLDLVLRITADDAEGAMPDDATGAIRVLVVDDQSAMRSIIRQLLHQVGIDDVAEAENGEQAFDMLRSAGHKDPDVIICDIHMDQMDGTEFCNRVRRDEAIRNRAIPILMLNGDRDRLVHEVAQQLGAAKVLTKPITAHDLLGEREHAIGYSIGR